MAKNDNSKICAILSYLLIGIIWYFVDKDMQKDDFVKFHVKQGLVLFLFSIIWNVVINILFHALLFSMLGGLWFIIHLLVYVPLILVILGIINAVNGNKNELPVIGKFASKFTF